MDDGLVSRRAAGAWLLGWGLAGGQACLAQTSPRPATWPTQPLRIIVPAGGGSVPDVRARWLAQRLAEPLGQPVIVENRPGAGGNLAMEKAARSVADGHTMVMTHVGLMVFNPLLFDKLGYDAQRDFTLLTRVGVGPLLLLVQAGSPISDMADLVRRSQEQPGAMNFASPGIGTPPHLAAELLLREARLSSLHIPSSNPMQPMADLIGGSVQWLFEGTPVALPMVKSGRVRALAVTASRRLPSLPEVPTMAEAGLPAVEFSGWSGLAVPSATPPQVLEQLYRAVAAVLATDEARAWFGSVGNEPGGETPQDCQRMVQAEFERWGPVIRDARLGERR
jgi:tripartite-type tricarboxylate transporter receptor subunit TctC